MAIFRMDELRNMSPEELADELHDLEDELIREKGIVKTGGAPENPGRIKDIRKAIARIKTVQRERTR